MTFQYLTVSCISAIGHVPNISRYGTCFECLTGTEILWYGGRIPEIYFRP